MAHNGSLNRWRGAWALIVIGVLPAIAWGEAPEERVAFVREHAPVVSTHHFAVECPPTVVWRALEHPLLMGDLRRAFENVFVSAAR